MNIIAMGTQDGVVRPCAEADSNKTQHFPLYLISYGLFRFGHEFARDTPRVGFGFTGYQVAAFLVMALGLLGFIRRHRQKRAGLGLG